MRERFAYSAQTMTVRWMLLAKIILEQWFRSCGEQWGGVSLLEVSETDGLSFGVVFDIIIIVVDVVSVMWLSAPHY